MSGSVQFSAGRFCSGGQTRYAFIINFARTHHDEEDGAWQFHTGEMVTEADARIVSLSSIVAQDVTIKQLADLPLGWVATRIRVEAEWQRVKP